MKIAHGLAAGCLLSVLLFSIPVSSQADDSSSQSADPTGAFSLQGKVIGVSGNAQFRNTTVVLWQDIVVGQELSAGDRIKTGEDGQLKIELNNGNILYVKPNSEIFIKQLSKDPRTDKYVSVFETIEARVKAEVNDKKNLKTFEIRTPTAVAGVRGTIFYVNSNKTATEVFVERGQVNLRNNFSDRERNIKEGLAAQSSQSGELSKPLPPPPEKLMQIQGQWEPLPPPPPGALPPPPPPGEGDKTTQLQPPPGTQPLPDGTLPPPPDGQLALNTSTSTTTYPTTTSTTGTYPTGTTSTGTYPTGTASTSTYPTGTYSIYPTGTYSTNTYLTSSYTQQQTYQQQQTMLDRQISQEATKTDYITAPPPPTGSSTGDSDGDGILNNVDLDDDNDFMPDDAEILAGTDPTNKDTDNDGLTDWEEINLLNTQALNSDSDGDGVNDLNDYFPKNSALTLSAPPDLRAFRYNKISTISGLRGEIQTMLADSGARQHDYIMDRVSDAQGAKVLKDSTGNWARVEQYIFRPTSQEIGIFNITYRAGAPAAPLSSMLVDLQFNNSLNGMSSSQIKNLPWDKYFSGVTTIDYQTATAPAVFPVMESVKFENQGGVNWAKVVRGLNGTINCGASCTQTITGNGIVINNPGIGAVAFSDSFTINPPPTGSVSSTNSPAHIAYIGNNPQGWGVPQVQFDIYPIDVNGNMVGDYTFPTIWSVLGTNLNASLYNDIGLANYLQIDATWSGGATSQVIYIPLKHSDIKWRGDAQWPDQLTW